MELKNCIGFGLAGNFTGHLEQAGEMNDFESLNHDLSKPQGIFPFYLPRNYSSKLHAYPYSDKFQVVPNNENAQLEPEIVLLCKIEYIDNKVQALTALKFSAFNDCTIRKEGASKISEKKNWGLNSKGLSSQWIDIDNFDENGIMSKYSLASFVTRHGQIHPYGIEARISNYTLFYQALLDWVVDCMNTQKEEGPLEDISKILLENNYPEHCVLAIGATAYEEFGEKNYLQTGDLITVVAFNSEIKNIRERVLKNDLPEGASLLKQMAISYI